MVIESAKLVDIPAKCILIDQTMALKQQAIGKPFAATMIEDLLNRGISLKKIAEEVKLSESSLKRVLNDVKEPNTETFEKVLRFYCLVTLIQG
jgi:AraC-like DNA-binding protein